MPVPEDSTSFTTQAAGAACTFAGPPTGSSAGTVSRYLSYAYQYQEDPNRRPIGTSSEPTFPFMADANPYISGRVAYSTLATDRISQYRGNSDAHTNREGQNVMYQDGHVSWEKQPDCGLSGNKTATVTMGRGRDNIYTVHASTPGATVDYGTTTGLAWSTPSGPGTCNLGSKSDACLVP